MTDASTANPFDASAAKPSGLGWLRFRRRLLGVVALAALSAIAFVALRRFAIGPAEDKLEAAIEALNQGDWGLARKCARELKSTRRLAPQAHFLQGAILLQKGYCYPALDVLEKVPRDSALKQRALVLAGQAWYRLGRHVEAQTVLLQSLESDPDSAEAHRWLAASYYDLGAIRAALEHLERTAVLDAADPRPHRLMGLIYKDYERYEDAVPSYAESLRRKSDQQDAPAIRQEMAACQLKVRRHEDALATLEPCADSPEIDALRAECYYALGRTKQAESHLDRALRHEPDNLEALLLQGSNSLEAGDAALAIKTFQRGVQSHPRDYTAHFRLAQAYANAGEPELSAAAGAEAEKIRVLRHEFAQLHREAWDRPGDINVRSRLAELAQELGRPELAGVWLRAAAALKPAAGAAP